jgi:hypothetical protein
MNQKLLKWSSERKGRRLLVAKYHTADKYEERRRWKGRYIQNVL